MQGRLLLLLLLLLLLRGHSRCRPIIHTYKI
jgi:hypothetical protein